MTKQELRIGNITQQGEIVELKHYSARVKYTSDKLRYALIQYEDLQPALLAKDWLEKLGFTPSVDAFYCYRKNIGGLTIECRLCSGHAYVDIVGALYIGRLLYVHQLQNLVFGLFQRELEVKP